MALSEEDRRILIDLSLRKSEKDLTAARSMADALPDRSVSASYYSVFHAAQALFLQYQLVDGSRKGRGHRSGTSRFSEKFVRSGIFSPELGKILGQLERLRNDADYSIQENITREDARESVQMAEKFTQSIQKHIRDQQQKQKQELTPQGEECPAALNPADIAELDAATALLKNQRATDNATFKGHEITPQQNDTLDLLEQIKKHVQADKAAMAKLESAGLSPEKDITVHKVARPGKFFSKETQGLEVVSRTRDSLMLIRGRCLFIYELKLLELQAPAQGIPGEKLDLEWPKTQEKARGAQAQEQERKRTQGRGRGLSL
jgi:uncharacterized protein (UPF0332 family)